MGNTPIIISSPLLMGIESLMMLSYNSGESLVYVCTCVCVHMCVLVDECVRVNSNCILHHT